MTTLGKLRVAVLSFAHVHAESYVMELTARDDVEVLGFDPIDTADEARGAAFAQRLGIDLAANLDEVAAWKPHAVLVASENSRHRDLVEWAAAHGCHVLCEKPIATTLQDAVAMIDACDAAGVSLMIAYPARFAPAYAALKETVRRGDLGRVIATHGSNNGKSPAEAHPWFATPELSGGGSIIDHTVHLADLLDDLFEGVPARRVYAAANDILFENLDVESAGIVSVEYADGRIATIECGWTHPAAHPVWGGLDLTLIGDRAIVELDLFPPLATGYSNTGPTAVSGGPNLDAALLDAFLVAIREGRQPQPDGRAGLRSLAIVEAAYRSLSLADELDVDPLIRSSRAATAVPAHQPHGGTS